MSIHAGRLERWLGPGEAEHISRAMQGWYGPPIAVANVPGRVVAHGDGDFGGVLREGRFSRLIDRSIERTAMTIRRAVRRQQGKLPAGFSSLSDLISEATAGAKRREFLFNKVGPTGVVGVTSSLWGLGPSPAAGAAGSVAPGGRAPTSATVGAFGFTNPTGGDTQHFVTGYPCASLQNTLLLYDRIFDVAKTMNATTVEAVTGVPTRYQNATASAADYIGGNFLFVEVDATQLAATAHNWTTCLYLDQASASSTLPSLTGNSAAIVRRLDHPANQWYAPLETGDVGVKALTQMQCSALVATGLINFVIGHPIAWMPCPLPNFVCVTDGINSAFNLARIMDSAALAFLEVAKPATTATTYTGSFTSVAG
jgi:hypothetical protein